ncbi:exonuclease RecJ [Marininema mesophilum]|uniref:Single-stranded-DNA-specific exonuclease RecJ n=1 Tax=Marininema mesophilum TaxID=1048340 RepID=A0A1H2SBZ7_9BACL|nr:single-stranded-DNA-specific exonuclease RecJ [Marininema mesophilum]SDW29183.1 exonuclease RecJ [Marininema mesophilum]
MLQSKTRWQTVDAEESCKQLLANELGIHPLTARLLCNRGVTDVEEARHFLTVDASQLHDPLLMDGMQDAVDRIRSALEKKEKIRIYGDYDADGVSSTGVMMKVLRSLGANVDYYIPNRFTEGYGLNGEALHQAVAADIDLMISVDTGISAVAEAALAKELGIDLIITDHHEPPETIPDALVVLNPKKLGCSYPFEMLAGVGVAFKLCQALLGRVPEEVLEIAALGTIADLVPLLDENRVLAALGLKEMNRRHHLGLSALMDVSGCDGEIGAGHVGFSLAPRINASGRLDSANQAVELLLTGDSAKAQLIAEELDSMNRERQQLVEEISTEAMAMVEAEAEKHQHFIVVAAPGWNVGVIGIVASRLVEKYYRPVIVLGIDEEKGTAKGSARSIVGLDMYQALNRCKELLPHYGGHPMAAGMSLPVENLAELHQRLSEVAKEWLTEEDYIPLSKVDAELSVAEVDLPLVEELERLAPYGVGNATPRFCIKEARLGKMQRIGRDKNHLKLLLEAGGRSLDAVGFRLGELAEEISPSANLEILGELSVNEWNNRRMPQLLIRDISIPHVQVFDWRGNGDKRKGFYHLSSLLHVLFIVSDKVKSAAFLGKEWSGDLLSWQEAEEVATNGRLRECRTLVLMDLPVSTQKFPDVIRSLTKLERLYFAYGDAELDGELSRTPDREQFKRLYVSLIGKKGIRFPRDTERLARITGLSSPWIRFMTKVFAELGFLRLDGGNVELIANAEKRPLTESPLYSRQLEREKVQELFVYSSTRDLYQYIHALLPYELNLGGTESWTSKKKSG